MNCFRCDGKGQYRNEFGLMEKCDSCQSKEMTFENADEQGSDDQYDWEKTKEKRWAEIERTKSILTESTSKKIQKRSTNKEKWKEV